MGGGMSEYWSPSHAARPQSPRVQGSIYNILNMLMHFMWNMYGIVRDSLYGWLHVGAVMAIACEYNMLSYSMTRNHMRLHVILSKCVQFNQVLESHMVECSTESFICVVYTKCMRKCYLMAPGLSKDIQCHDCIPVPSVANHWINHKVHRQSAW